MHAMLCYTVSPFISRFFQRFETNSSDKTSNHKKWLNRVRLNSNHRLSAAVRFSSNFAFYRLRTNRFKSKYQLDLLMTANHVTSSCQKSQVRKKPCCCVTYRQLDPLGMIAPPPPRYMRHKGTRGNISRA